MVWILESNKVGDVLGWLAEMRADELRRKDTAAERPKPPAVPPVRRWTVTDDTRTVEPASRTPVRRRNDHSRHPLSPHLPVALPACAPSCPARHAVTHRPRQSAGRSVQGRAQAVYQGDAVISGAPRKVTYYTTICCYYLKAFIQICILTASVI